MSDSSEVNREVVIHFIDSNFFSVYDLHYLMGFIKCKIDFLVVEGKE